jgi:[ribosomal protein S18]-alanine N-acetyltransferase
MSAEPSFSREFIRPMQQADVHAVMEIERRAYPYPWSEGIFRDCLRAGYQCDVYALGGTIRGYAIWSVAAGEGHLLNLCVDPSWQGHGVGRELLEYLMHSAARLGAQALFLEVRPSNTAAIRLYERAGFGEIDRRRGYYPAAGGREDALVMACHLSTEEPPAA